MLNSALRTRPGQLNHAHTGSFVQPANLAPTEPSVVPFAKLPHGLASDSRLSPTDRLVGVALLFWACDRPTATMSNQLLANYLDVSLSMVERAMRALKTYGYVATEAIKPTVGNMTGRIVHLVWVEDPSVLPAAPDRRTGKPVEAVARSEGGSVARDGASLPKGPSPVTQGALHGRRGGSVADDGEGPSPATDKEDVVVKNPKNWKKPERKTSSSQRQRSQAEALVDHPSEPASRPELTPVAPLDLPDLCDDPKSQDVPQVAKTVELAMAEIRQAASMADEPINAGPGRLLSEGQRRALDAMTEAERGAFEQKSLGMQADILRPFDRGFDEAIFARVTRSMLAIPRFVREQRTVDRSTPGLVAAVADGDPRLVADLAESLCRDLGGPGDRRRWGAIHSLAMQVLRGEVEAEDILDAHRQAMGPRAENRGAVFTHALKRTGWNP